MYKENNDWLTFRKLFKKNSITARLNATKWQYPTVNFSGYELTISTNALSLWECVQYANPRALNLDICRSIAPFLKHDLELR